MGKRVQGIEDDRIIGEQRLRVVHADSQTPDSCAGDLQFDVVSGAQLRRMRFHRSLPRCHYFRRRNVDQDRPDAGWFSLGGNGVVKELTDGVRRPFTQFDQATEARETGGIPHQLPQPPVVGVLVFDEGRCEHEARRKSPNQARQFQGVSRADLKMRIAVQFREFERSAQSSGRHFGLGRALGRRAVRAGLAA